MNKLARLNHEVEKAFAVLQTKIGEQKAYLVELGFDLRPIESKHKKAVVRITKPCVPMTPILAQQIKEYHAAHPTVIRKELARKFNVNSGRISETLGSTKRK